MQAKDHFSFGVFCMVLFMASALALGYVNWDTSPNQLTDLETIKMTIINAVLSFMAAAFSLFAIGSFFAAKIKSKQHKKA